MLAQSKSESEVKRADSQTKRTNATVEQKDIIVEFHAVHFASHVHKWSKGHCQSNIMFFDSNFQQTGKQYTHSLRST